MVESKSIVAVVAVVDDEESVRKYLERLSRSAGINAEAFSTGGQFLSAIQNLRADCVVLDLHMPELSGFDVLAEMTRSYSSVPVVVITRHDTPESRLRAMQGGASAYLLKPVDDIALLDAIAAAVASRVG